MHPQVRHRLVRIATRCLSEEFLLQARWELVLVFTQIRATFSLGQRRRVKQLNRTSGLKVNLGSGPSPIAGWVNVDTRRNADLIQRLGHPLALGNGCAAVVFSEHVLNMLSYPAQARIFLREACRILEDTGVFRLIVPDADRYMRAYVSRNQQSLSGLVEEGSSPLPIELISCAFHARGFHRSIWDYELLRLELLRAGFAEVRLADFQDSAIAAANIDFDQHSRRNQSLYVEAYKLKRDAVTVDDA